LSFGKRSQLTSTNKLRRRRTECAPTGACEVFGEQALRVHRQSPFVVCWCKGQRQCTMRRCSARSHRECAYINKQSTAPCLPPPAQQRFCATHSSAATAYQPGLSGRVPSVTPICSREQTSVAALQYKTSVRATTYHHTCLPATLTPLHTLATISSVLFSLSLNSAPSSAISQRQWRAKACAHSVWLITALLLDPWTAARLDSAQACLMRECLCVVLLWCARDCARAVRTL
jgi:hypothetical protein